MSENQNIQEMQTLEQSLQNVLLQKQAFQMELQETKSALREIETSGEEVFKIIGQLMIKTEKPKLIDELSKKEKLLNLRLKTIEQQENSTAEKLEKLRENFMRTART